MVHAATSGLCSKPVSPVTVDLKPKEHGAYAILIIPIATSLAISGVSVTGGAVAIASLAGFFAHEPLLVVLGRRGLRAKRDAPQARSLAPGRARNDRDRHKWGSPPQACSPALPAPAHADAPPRHG